MYTLLLMALDGGGIICTPQKARSKSSTSRH